MKYIVGLINNAYSNEVFEINNDKVGWHERMKELVVRDKRYRFWTTYPNRLLEGKEKSHIIIVINTHHKEKYNKEEHIKLLTTKKYAVIELYGMP